MRYPKGMPSHGRLGACPNEWNSTPCICGLYTMDAVIKKSRNADVPSRLKLYTESETAYGNRTAYNGYQGYSKGD